MTRKQPPPHVARLVWRITDEAPMGEYVRMATAAKDVGTRPKEPTEIYSGGWVDSSFDLLHGTDVSDATDTLSPDQLDDLFRPDIKEYPGPKQTKR